jgi:hypothetical protein
MIKKITLAVALALSSQAYAAIGPSSSATPYVTPSVPSVSVTSILTVGDAAANGYQMVGIPDGLGAYDNNDGTFTLLMNHELGATAGVTRAHGSAGAFVSQWTINKTTLAVTAGKDMIQSPSSVNTWNTTTSAWQTGTTAFARLCSADLPAASAFYNSATGKGYNGRIFMNGEETGAEGRGFGFVATGAAAGTVYETPYLGKFSWENSLANPYSGDKTVVIGTDDSTPGQVYMYVGNKQTTGNAVEQAGLHNGSLYGIKTGVAFESGAINGTFTMAQVNPLQTGANLQLESNTKQITNFARPEDGHWADADTFYFVTTGGTVNGIGNTSKLYRADFTDANDLTLGGIISMVQDSALLTGTDGAAARSFDNMTVADNGKIYIQEDPGNASYIAKTWSYDPSTGIFTQILESDRSRFITGAPGFLTQDEESSGVIDITSILGKNDGQTYLLGVMQAHYGISGALVEGGQLYVAAVPEADTYAMLLAGLGLMGAVNRRRNNKK